MIEDLTSNESMAEAAIPLYPRKMKICILQSSAGGTVFEDCDPACVPEIYLKDHEVTCVTLKKTEVAKNLVSLAKENFDCFVNLCDGAWDEDRPGAEVRWLYRTPMHTAPCCGARIFFVRAQTAFQIQLCPWLAMLLARRAA
jgi:hypothetical protein